MLTVLDAEFSVSVIVVIALAANAVIEVDAFGVAVALSGSLGASFRQRKILTLNRI